MNLIAGACDVEAARRDLDALTEAARTALRPITAPGGREASPDRVYTGADDTEAYVAIPGAQLDAVLAQLAVIVHANQELEKFHRARAAVPPAL